ncbi:MULTISPECIES: hypothetical protein [unclassified Azospirillum]|uniref:hypothetical protein n=1 Tax=unclassified Azospirillum TaxID=2630922 RepID=UPI0011B1DD57|nr:MULTISPECIES: hypothetical protein [unclassified Azospirillum]
MSQTYHVKVNGGPERQITVEGSEYISAAAAVPAIFGINADGFPLRIVIWVPVLLPEYGPYTYSIAYPGAPVIFES